MIGGINRERLVLLKFTKEEAQLKLQWEHAEEFEYHHQMYDVVSTVTKHDTIYYWCLPDEEETKLNRHLRELATKTAENDQQNKKDQKQLLYFYESLYHSKVPKWQSLLLPLIVSAAKK